MQWLTANQFMEPNLRKDNSLILQSKISRFFHGFLQVLDCGDPLGPSIFLENVFLQFVNICYGPQIHFSLPWEEKKLLKEQNRAKYGHFPHFPSILGYIANFASFPFSDSYILALVGQECIYKDNNT